MLVKSMGEGTWSDEVYRNASSGALSVSSSVTFTGTYGSLQVPLGATPNVVLVAGGIGITPMLGLLQQMSQMEKNRPKSVTLIWSLRDEELAYAVVPYFEEAYAKLQEQGVSCHFQLHLTIPQPKAATPLDDSAKETNISPFLVMFGRPRIQDIVAARIADEKERIGVYCCGPAALMESAETFAKSRPHTYLHTELFEF